MVELTQAATFAPITPSVSPVALLPVAAVACALLGSLAVALAGARTRLRSALAIGTCALVFACMVLLYEPVYRGMQWAGEHLSGVSVTLGALGPSGLVFSVDPTSLLIGLMTSLAWLLAMIFGTSYMRGEHARSRFDAFMLLTLAGDIGVLVAGDYLTLFIFFELMAIGSYVLVVHGQNPQSLRAGDMYLYMSFVGGLVLLGGVMLLAAFTGSTAIAPAGARLAELPRWLALTIPLALIFGFSTKAGMFFLHVWLPEAHPVAPSPASALLSGLMVKVGVYGILRSATVLLIPGEEAGGQLAQTIGIVLIAGAVATMVAGMMGASFRSNAKELLAFSTISQVGFIVLGIGCAAYLGADGAMAVAAVLMYVVSHAAFKAALFLTIGAVIWRTREQTFSRLGGMAYRMPVTAAAAFVAVSAIIGVPGTAGFASKSMLHHAVLEVISASSAGYGPVPTWAFLIVEALFVGVAAGTFAYSTRMFILVFLGKVPSHLKEVKPETWPMKVAYAPLIVLLLGIGLAPNKFIETFIGPALSSYGLSASSHAYELVFNPATGASSLPILYNPGAFFSSLVSPAVAENVLAIASSVFFAGTFYLVGHKIGVFDMPIPYWASLAVWYRRAAGAVTSSVSRVATNIDQAWDRLVWVLGVDIWLPSRVPAEKKPALAIDEVAGALSVMAGGAAVADRVLDRFLAGALVDAWLSGFAGVAEGSMRPLPAAAGKAQALAAMADHYIDAALTTVMVDSWVSGPQATPRVHRGATTADHYIDTALTTVMVDSWVSGPVDSSEECLRPSVRPEPEPLTYSLTRELIGRGIGAWRIALFVAGAAFIVLVVAVAMGWVVLP